MKRRTVISQLKNLLSAMDKLEFIIEQNRKQISETRLLVATLARTVYFGAKNEKGKPVRKPAAKKKA